MARSNRRRVVMMAAASVPLLMLACNNIVGLTDYNKAECSGGGDCLFDGSPGFDVNQPDAGGDASDANVVIVDATGAPPVSWAAWKMPNYDGGPDNKPLYQPGVNGTIVDSVTGLVWRPVPTAENKDVNFADAQAVCKAAGDKWRLPSRIELVSILDLATGVKPGPTGGYANPNFQLAPNVYWTSSNYRELNAVGLPEVTADMLGVGFDGQPTNLVKRLQTSATARVICVAAQ
jgi:hypothetical protein